MDSMTVVGKDGRDKYLLELDYIVQFVYSGNDVQAICVSNPALVGHGKDSREATRDLQKLLLENMKTDQKINFREINGFPIDWKPKEK